MKIKIDQKEFHEALTWVSRVIPTRPTHPVLANVVLRAADGRLTLTAFDLATFLEASVLADVPQSGAIAVPPGLVKDIVGKLDGELTLDVGESGLYVSVASGGKYEIRGMPADEYPDLPRLESGATEMVLPAETIASGLAATLFAVSPDEMKQVLQGVNLKFGEGSLAFAATDGHRLAVYRSAIAEDPDREGWDVTVSGNALKDVARLLRQAMPKAKADGDEAPDSAEVSLRVDEIHVEIAAESDGRRHRVGSRVLDGRYPNYNQLLPSDFAGEIRVDRAEFDAAIGRVGIVAQRRNDIVKLTFGRDSVEISAEADEVGNARESIPAEYVGNLPPATAVNVKYVRDALKAVGGDRVRWRMNGAVAPIVVASADDNGATCLVMPIQLRS